LDYSDSDSKFGTGCIKASAMKKTTFSREYKLLCSLLRDARQEANISQVELAARLKETQSDISKFERGERRLDLVQLGWWCKALGCSLSEFIKRYEQQIGSRK
jgi:ribosome-binding protein aMBF1 (putative translation factor)